MKRFAAETSGSITVMILPLFLLLIFATGLAIDLVRYEAERASLQDAMDRGVLAAASLTQKQHAEIVLNDYIASSSFADDDTSVEVAAFEQPRERLVDAVAQNVFDTAFLSMVGVPEMDLGVGAAAIESGGRIEISLVLDLSGSMARENTGGGDDTRLEVLRAAASEFIDAVFEGDNIDRISVSLVPYAGEVNAGPFFDLMLNGAREHNYSSCVKFDDNDFNFSDLPAANSLAQAQHFQWFSYERLRGQTSFPFDPTAGREAEWGWCPNDDMAILPFSSDPEALKLRIANFVGHDGTGTQNGLKWGIALLDETTRFYTQQLVANGTLPLEAAEHPLVNDPQSVEKIVVLMTDGRIRYQQSIRAEHYDTPEDIEYYAFNEDELACCSSGNLYAKNQLTRHASKTTLNSSSKRTADEGLRREQFAGLCGIARDAGIRVYTIGFDIDESSNAYQDMSDCATTQADFFDVDGLELFDAFSQIRVDIQKLKLVMR